MKTWKKLAALLLTAVMGAGLTGTSLAAEAPKFADVSGHWAEAEITRVVELGLIDGKSAGAFAPDENMTRAVLVQALYRLVGSPDLPNDAKNPFTDVSEDAACRNAVVWANDNSVVGGKNAAGTVFDPDGNVKRQEMAKILDLFAAQAVGKVELMSRIDVLSGYADASDVAGWARPYMNWAVASGFITGASGGRLDPDGTVTRAQAAVILCRYMDDVSTGDASMDKSRNEDGIGENELLVVSFGTSFNDNRVATIGAVEEAMEKAFPDYSVRRGFTSNIIIEHVQRRDGQVIDDVKEALDRAKANGVKNLLVQPTHLMNGYEYGDLVKELEKRLSDFETIKIGAPLLTSDADFAAVAEAMAKAVPAGEKTAVCYMGHGTEADSNSVYARMQQELRDAGYDNYFIGTVESEPTAEDLVKLVKAGGYAKVILRPMMIVAGDHANNDMAGDEPDSWKSVFAAAGLEVQCEVKGLGELEAVQQLLAAHARDAKLLGETGIAVQPNPENEEAGGALADGVYTIDVECEQSMFRIDSCELTVQDGKMTAALTLGSASFDKMIVGAAAAAAASAEGAVDGVEADGKTTFTLPVAELDKPLDYAAHSVNKDAWYDRTLTFVSDTAAAK